MTFKVKDGLSVGANTILDASGNLTVPGKTTLSNTTASGASLNLGTGTADPSSPVAGDVWNNTGVLKIRQAAATKTVAFLDSTITGNAANVTGTVAIANGGTNGSATPTAGAVPYGTGTAFAFTAAGTSGQYLTSAGAGVPVWATLPTTIANATNVTITDDVATATSQYLYFGSATSGNTGVKSSSSRLTFVPSTGNLTTIGSVGVGGTGVIFSGSTSGTTNVRASAAAGTTTITLPATTGTVVTTGDTGTVTSTMIADGTIVNADINASAAIAVSKLAASTISGITLGSDLGALTLGTGLTGTSYNGSTAVTAALAASGVTAATYGSSTSIPVIAIDTYGRITSASNSSITIGAGTLSSSTVTAGLTNTTVALNFSAAYNANSTTNVTINPVVGPAITALSTIMTGAPTGLLSKTGADTYALVTNAPTATKLATATTIQGVSFDGSAAITVATSGTGVTVTGTSIAIGQAVATSSNVQFNAIGVGAANSTAGTITATSFNSITGLSSSLPLVASGSGSIGTGTAVARVDHVHPVQTTVSGNAGTVTDGAYLSASNTFTGTNAFNGTTIHTIGNVVSTYTGYIQLGGRGIRKLTTGNSIEIINAANTATTHTFGDAGELICTGALTASSVNSITGLSSTTPVVASTADIGTGTTVARADHVHPAQTTISGNAATATVLATARNINGVSFNGSADITVTAAAGTLTGATLASGVTASSLTSVGTLTSLAVTGAVTGSSFNSITGLSSTTPIVAGTAAVGTGTTAARADHVHPVQTSVSGSAATFTSTSQNSQFNAIGVGTSNSTAGSIVATGNITAYSSDSRLKTNVVAIPNALQKIQQIGGYSFDWDLEKCESIGFTPEQQHEHGVLAQEIQSVLPDVVVPAAFDKDYLTVRYERIVPLLIEAIKELEAQVAELRASR